MTVILDSLPAQAQVVDSVVRMAPTSGAVQGPARFSQVVKHGQYVHISGQTGTHTKGKPSYEKQSKQVLELLDAQLSLAGTSKANLLSVRVYLRDIKDGRAAFNKAWQEWVAEGHLPARTVVQAALIDPNLLVEVEAVAVVPPAPLLALPAVPEWAAKLPATVREQLLAGLAAPKGWAAPAGKVGRPAWAEPAAAWLSAHATEAAAAAGIVVALGAAAALALSRKAA